jgi:hypothetical protein
MADVWGHIEKVAGDYKAAGGKLPSFDAAASALMNRGGAYLSWIDLQGLRTELGQLWNKASEGSRDEAAVGKLRDSITEKLRARAAELGREKQFDAYNELWKTRQAYLEKGVVGKLMDAPDGQTFFNTLKDPKTASQLTQAVNSLKNFGLPEDFVTKLVDDHRALHKYVTDAQATGFGKIKVIMKHPIAGPIGVMAGGAAGAAVGKPFLGGILGGMGAAALVDRVRAARQLRRLGGCSLADWRAGVCGYGSPSPRCTRTSQSSRKRRSVRYGA